ncbi:MAG: hypothetical protein P1U64_09315 [Alcanivoracaceae bacterium]|nr:hypothetical protein [Alcanivoracaceae bacterium]
MSAMSTKMALIGALTISVYAHAGDNACQDSPGVSGTLEGAAAAVAVSLNQPLDQADPAPLSHYLSASADSSRSSDYVMRNYARVALAASQVRQGAFDQARQILTQVELDSPAAVRAALLLAESYRMQGQQEVAGKWLLRIADRYSSDPDALSGLLMAADDLAERGEASTALAVYSRVLEKSLANINSLKGLAEDTSSLYQIMMEGRIDNTRAVNSEVIQRALRGSRFGAVEHYRNLLQAQRQLACLESRQETLREKAFEASLSNTNEAAMVTMLEGEATRTRADIAAMEAQLAAANPWDEVEDLQNSLAQARESLATQQKRLQELRPAVASQAGMTAEQQQALEQRIDDLRQQVSSDRDQINQALRQVLLSLRDDYRELAGDAQLGRASMLQLYASN